MSLRSKWRQFVNWVHERRVASSDEFDPEFVQQAEDWTQGETQAKADEFNQAKSWWVTLGFFVADYWDSKLGTRGPLPPDKGPVTGNVDLDAIILTSWAVALVLLLLSFLKRLFR